MPPSLNPSTIRNKLKRQQVVSKSKKAKNQLKLKKRLERAKVEGKDPGLRKKRIAENVPRTLDNMREFDPSFLTADPSARPTLPSTSSASASGPADPSSSNPSNPPDADGPTELDQDIANDPFASYFNPDPTSENPDSDPSAPPKILITTSPKPTRATYAFCDELVGVFPGAEFRERKKKRGTGNGRAQTGNSGKVFEVGRIAGWAADRGYRHLCVVNEDGGKPNAITLVHLPAGPSAYFKLTSIELTKDIFGHARATPHYPELVLNGFVTRLGHAVGRMFQTAFPPLPEFQGRQVVTLHNQRDFLFFRRHRYAFRSTEKVALQEIGPRFTLKLRWMKKGIPAVVNYGEVPKPLTLGTLPTECADGEELFEGEGQEEKPPKKKTIPPKHDEFIWQWKPELETSRKTFFL